MTKLQYQTALRRRKSHDMIQDELMASSVSWEASSSLEKTFP